MRRMDAFCRLLSTAYRALGSLSVKLGDGVAGFKQLDGGALEVQTKSGKTYPADIVILALGVRPDTTLARMAAEL